MLRSLAALLIAFTLTAAATAHAQAQARTGPVDPAARAAHLRRGVNLSDWFRQVADERHFDTDRAARAVTRADLDRLRALGIDHVRLAVNPAPLFRAAEADRIPADQLAVVDGAVRLVLEAGLAVQIDLQPDQGFKRQLTNDRFVEQFADFWRALAAHFADTDPERVFLEIINEPELGDPYRWYGVQTRLAAAIREGAPRHTIIATGAQYSDEDDLLFQQPLRDPNVIYTFHFYQPFLFTHQGATWSEYYWHFLKGVPWPARREEARAAAAAVPDPLHRLAVERYGESHWGRERVDFEIGQVRAWADRYRVPVICNEFGVYRQNAAEGERVAWLRDVRRALEQQGLGWTAWDFDGTFGIATRRDGVLRFDTAAVEALGLGGR
ncbi:MAG: cellulase family glycosylhydrolase [Vicinamibacterales bacterium]